VRQSKPTTCFVSFSPDSSRLALELIDVLDGMGIEGAYHDELASHEISREVLSAIEAADFICAVTGAQPADAQVAFELGLALGLGKPVLLLTKTGSDIGYDLAGRIQVVRTKSGHIDEVRRDVSRFVKHVRLKPTKDSNDETSLNQQGQLQGELSHLRGIKDVALRRRSLTGLVAEAFEQQGAEVLREGGVGRAAEYDLLVWSDPLVSELGGPIIVECKYYAGGTGSVLVNARHAFNQLASFVESSSAKVALLVYDHDRPNHLTLTEYETPQALAFSIDDFVMAIEAGHLADEIRRKRARAARLRTSRGLAG